MLWPTVSCKRVPANVKTSLLTSARMTVWTRKLLACPPERTMSKRSASESGTRTSFWFSFSDSSELLKNFTEKFQKLWGLELKKSELEITTPSEIKNKD